MSEIENIKHKLSVGELSGKDGKMFLAETIVRKLHGASNTEQARREYLDLTKKGSSPVVTSLKTVDVTESQNIIDILVKSGLATSNSAARRLIEAGGVRINNLTIGTDWIAPLTAEELILQVGKKLHSNYRLLNIK
jgi:tyrosyl-tRNA synthetase